jgi:hypothetical protein
MSTSCRLVAGLAHKGRRLSSITYIALKVIAHFFSIYPKVLITVIFSLLP